MLTRILVMGSELLEEATRIASGLGAEAVPAAGGVFPPGAAAIVAAAAEMKPAVEAAVRLGGEQQVILRLVADAIDCREEIPLGASERVRQHAERLATVLKLSPADQLTLERA
ncbi:MAG: hypothetical protein IT368_01450, partial [Candidatus Hydrogenedentes bacterium]|nr:hypothetical protein [Candidatus Hydrogenedentota bacterium]